MDSPHSHAELQYVLARILRDFMHFMQQSGLSAPQIHTLLYIYHAGECRLSDVRELADSSKPAASQLVERLVQQGLVERTEDPLDRRNKKLRLTKKSLDLIQGGVASNPSLRDLMSHLTARQHQAVHTALGYLAEAGRQIHSPHERKEFRHA